MIPVMKPCPICKAANLTRHCPDTNATCTWTRCTRCGATLDLRRKRGIGRNNQPVIWPTPEATQD